MRTITYKLLSTAILAFMIAALPACDLVDPSKIENPNITADNLLANPNGGTTALVTGLRRYLNQTIGESALIGDMVSDNLDNRTSFYANELSFPRTIIPKTFTYPAMYLGAQRMKAMADFGLSTIIPNDVLATNDQKAEVHFHRGLALIILGENFTNFPIVEKGPAVTAREALQEAVRSLNTAYNLTTQATMRVSCKLALARAYRMLGDKANAANEANAALALTGGTNHVHYALFEATNVANVYSALRGRTTNDIQPNPKLDFLDPKYTTNSTSVPVLKSEEAHLILAEVALANNDLAGAKTAMKNAITLARSRATIQFADPDTRANRPNNSAMTVKPDADSPEVPGLIQRRSGSTVTVYPISGTHFTTAMIDALVSKYEHIYTLYWLRQEIFFAEGRRMSDLGIRLPVPQVQIDGNPNVTVGSPGTSVVVPSYIPPSDEMRHFSVSGTVVTIKWDMNKVLAQNISTVSPLGVTP